MSKNPFHGIKAFLFDGDGVLYKEDKPLPGSIEFLQLLQKKEKQIFILTNNSTKTREEFQKKLSTIGIEISLKNILSSSYLTAMYLSEETPGASIYAIGEEGLKKELRSFGLDVINSWQENNSEDIFEFNLSEIDYVVTGMDRDLTYVKLARTMNILKNKKTKFIATNSDMTFPTEQGLIPGGGAMITIIEQLTNRKIEKIIGKPNPLMYQTAVTLSKTSKDYIMMFGDRLETDIVGANKLGIKTCLVLTGVTSIQDLEGLTEEKSPDIIMNDLRDAIEAMTKD
ncbi:MAG: HAD-IIA family hydrolase [Candidatus Heimdallarchaeota archaeon]|nr:HAD-IIA family hydrolase [Candidatus Heimdallarchaeota archaeon]MCK4954885.1 HAD-IIA family hydrolase [Candidatus Heimdallarchaeota archaeon]